MGEQKLFFDEVAIGDEAPAISHKLTRTDLVKYAGASGDFNPMHHDEVAAQAAQQQKAFDAYVKQTAGTSGGSNVDELAKLADLKSKGVITDAEFDAQKAKLLS